MAEMQQSFDDVLSNVAVPNGMSMGTPIKKSTLAKAAPVIERKEAENERLEDSVARDVGSDGIPLPAMLRPPPPPKVEYNDESDAFKQMGPMLAIWGSLATRHPMVSAMNAFGSSLQAQQQNDHEKYKEQRQQYEDNLKYAMEENKQNLQIYEAIRKDQKLSVDERLALIKSNAATLKDPLIAAAAANGDLNMVYDIMGKRSKAAGHLSSAASSSGNDKLDDPTMTRMAEQYIAGDKSVVTGMGYGKEGAARRQQLQKYITKVAKDKGMSAQDIVNASLSLRKEGAAETTLGHREANLLASINGLDQAANLVEEKIKEIDLGQYPTLNAITNEGRRQNGDPNIKELEAAINALNSEYAGVITRGGQPTVEARTAAKELTNPNLSTSQLIGIMKTMKQESSYQKKAIEKTENDIQKKAKKYDTLDELKKAHADGDVTSSEAQKIARDKGWAK